LSIHLNNVVKTYPAREAGADRLRALDGVSLEVAAGEWLAIMGPSGSGKSTLINLLGCLDRQDEGLVRIDGMTTESLHASQDALNRFRAEKIGLIFQQFHLLSYLTALENVMLAQYFHSMTDEAEARAALERVGLGDRMKHFPSQLSGGEQQRVCIARALINDPRIILADEPTGNLDSQNEQIVLRLLRDLHRQGRTVVMVTHDPAVARLADRIIELHHGRITSQSVFSGTEEQQFDEVLEEIWVLIENDERAEVERMDVAGVLPFQFALEKMEHLGLITRQAHSAEAPHTHKLVVNRCHEAVHPHGQAPVEHGNDVIYFTERGRHRAEDIIRRHRLAERLFMQTFKVSDEQEVEEQACKFEHILSPEVTDRICTFLGHPETCPHGNPIPRGACCPIRVPAIELAVAQSKR
jgi:putative ABC transport system ATP-binding protein